MKDVLEEILAHKKVEIAGLDSQALRRVAEQSPIPRDFLSAITGHPAGPKLIAELKRASPSKGVLAPHLDLLEAADICTENGASAISVLTDEKYFGGTLADLQEVTARFAQ